MCDFISWIEKDGRIFYLTYKDIYQTSRGKKLRNYCKSSDDYIGHGAIRFFYSDENGNPFEGGQEKECSDFSKCSNFPPEIIEAIKNNEFNYLANFPTELLEKNVLLSIPAYTEREKAYAEWKEAYAKWKEAYAKLKEADAKWKEADAEWDKAYAKWNKADTQKTLWDLFRVKSNRTAIWR